MNSINSHLLSYTYTMGQMLSTSCPFKTYYVYDGFTLEVPPKVGSGYCLKECEYFKYHYPKEKKVLCTYPEVQDVIR